MSRKKTVRDYQSLAISRCFEWLGPYPKNITANTNWRCPKDHEWPASFSNIKHRESGCPYCSGNMPPTETDYQAAAKKINAKWLGPLVTGKKNTWWICHKGHKWEATYNNVKGHETGCWRCHKKDVDDYHDLAKKRGFKWTGNKLPKDVHVTTSWRCQKDHEWLMNYNAISNNCGCLRCHKFKGPELIAQTLRAMGIDFETEMKFSTCKHKRPLPFDFFIPAANLLIEYQGEHHFKSVWGPLSNVKRNDKTKKDWAQQNGYELLYINYWDYDRIVEILANRLKDYAALKYYKQGAFI